MDAPLLQHREDLEDICISAVKERDIDSKLKQVMGDWENQDLTFSTFKTRGELLLKGADISEIVVLLEDSLMVLSSLMSNRYNAPFKPKIQEWVHKLSGSTEIIEQWLQVGDQMLSGVIIYTLGSKSVGISRSRLCRW